jgi:dGTPase
MKHKLKQEFQLSDRLNPEIEKGVPLSCKALKDIERSEFTKDRDRILFSRPFRRLQHKAQVFSNETGDHYRTRLTHTLEVSQIARSLARYLDANEDLVEAIALGHDIGHTPFGHQGERVLDEVMSGEDKLGLIKYPLNFGGFKHNFNGLRVLDVVQSKFEDYEGLNLSW